MTSLWWDFSSYLPNKRFPVFRLVVKQFPNLKFSPNVLHFYTFRIILFVLTLHTRSSSCKLHVGTCTRKLLLIPLIAYEKRQCFGTPCVCWDQPQCQYCSRLHDAAPRTIEGLYQAVHYCSYLRGSQLSYISISFIVFQSPDGLVVTE